jgi:hypothetical protein
MIRLTPYVTDLALVPAILLKATLVLSMGWPGVCSARRGCRCRRDFCQPGSRGTCPWW